jgi:FkbM family methyltransferase
MNLLRNSKIYRPIQNWRIAKKVLKWSETDDLAYQFYSTIIQTNSIIFDVGANIGKRTKIFLKFNGKVVAVEPQKQCVDILTKAFGKKAIIISKALAQNEGISVLHIDASTTLSSMSGDWIQRVKDSGRFKEHNWGEEEKVATTTLDKLIAVYGEPLFIKIDVEGFEFQVVQGLTKPVKFISIENTPERLESTIKCIDYLEHMGRIELNYSYGESMKWAFPKWLSVPEIKNKLEEISRSKEEGIGDVYIHYV